jgi:(2R)-3-sulfolactate dehydrogenase (NADP+)
MPAAANDSITLTPAEVLELAYTAFLGSRTSDANARCMARSIAAAEIDGLRSHGLMRVPPYCDQARCGKVDGHALPVLEAQSRPGVCIVDAGHGFAHPAIELGFTQLVPAARASGIAALAVKRSYNCGVVGHHVEALAGQGLVALAYANTPAAIAPWGGSRAFFGTNPVAFAAPRRAQLPLVIDQSASVVARGEVMLRARQNQPIPEGWALDSSGAPTTDAKAALAGSMLPAGGYKGAGLALMVEVLAAVLTGATLSVHASSFADIQGGPPGTGQLFIALDPAAFLGGDFAERLDALLAAMCSEPSIRLPGSRREQARARAAAQGIAVAQSLYDDVARRAQTENSGTVP